MMEVENASKEDSKEEQPAVIPACDSPEMPDLELATTAAAMARQALNNTSDDPDLNDLSPPPSTITPVSTPSVHDHTLDDETVVDIENGPEKSSPAPVVSDQEDEDMADADEDDQPVRSHYPKRKRSSIYQDLMEEKTESSAVVSENEGPPRSLKPRPRPTAAVKGVVIGYWRDSPVPDEEGKHSVIAFIDVRDRLRTRIQHLSRSGAPTPAEYPLPPGPGGSWVTFERIVFEPYLVGLDQVQVKEFVKIRSDQYGETEQQKAEADAAAVKEAVRRVELNPPPDNIANQSPIAYGPVIPDHAFSPRGHELKRRRTSAGFTTINTPLAATPTHVRTPLPAPQKILPSNTNGNTPSIPSSSVMESPYDAKGSRPTRILLGCWKLSSEANPANRHAVFGILGINQMFRVKLVRLTRDGRYIDGNFPSGPGALWIPYDQVDFEPHLKDLNRHEIKEYCRIRQRQIDSGEKEEDRIDNETKAVYEAQSRVARQASYGFLPLPQAAPDGSQEVPIRPAVVEVSNNVANGGMPDTPVPDLRQSRQLDSRTDVRPPRHSLPVEPLRQIAQQPQIQHTANPQLDTARALMNSPYPRDGFDHDAVERTTNIARREVARMEAVQNRTDQRHASREAANAQAANAAAQAANAAAQSVAMAMREQHPQPQLPLKSQQYPHQQQQQQQQQHHQQQPQPLAQPPPSQHQPQQLQQLQQQQLQQQHLSNGSRMRFSENEDVRALNRVWAQKEAHRFKLGAEDAKIHAGVKYERKTTGPFTGKLVSQGTIISIDGEDYVEYRVLTKPSFF